MSKHDEARRAFLINAAVGAGAAVAASGLGSEAQAKSHEAHEGHGGHDNQNNAAAPQHAMVTGHGAFLNDDDGATVAAFAERLMPGTPGVPGAHDAGVLNYIDLALSGAYADQQDFYRRGLAQLDAYCRKTHSDAFHRLSASQQDEVITALETGKASEFTWPTAQAFFNTLRTHTMEGMFADPIYGGNTDFAGWRLLGFPGTQMLYTEADMVSTQPFTREPIVGLQARAKTARRS
jgi:gluconate 2-dehydrogenase gamma chain